MIKICGNKHNIEEVAALKPDAMGFVFYSRSERDINQDEMLEKIRSIQGIEKVGVFVNENPVRIIQICHLTGITTIQLHGDESPGYCNEMSKKYKVIKALDANLHDLQEKLNSYSYSVDLVLLDNKGGGTGERFNHSVLSQINFRIPFMVAGGISPEDKPLKKQLNKYKQFYGLDINSRFEISPGNKNIELIKEFLKN